MKGEGITKLLMDEYAMKILMAAYKSEVTALDLSKVYEIPIAACYRRLKSLEGAGLLSMTGEKFGHHGKKTRHYKALIKSATITFIQGQMLVKLAFMNGTEKTMPMQVAPAV